MNFTICLWILTDNSVTETHEKIKGYVGFISFSQVFDLVFSRRLPKIRQIVQHCIEYHHGGKNNRCDTILTVHIEKKTRFQNSDKNVLINSTF